MPSFSIPLSGLDASSTGLSTIANNLANLNTVGFKEQNVAFQDLFYQQIGTSGDGNAIQVGVGTSVAGISSNLTQGSIQTTGVPTDVAIQGDGFFIVDKAGETLYTRAGNLTLGPTGDLLTQDGATVQGYTAVNGVINPSATLGPIALPTGLTNPPKATTNAQLYLNLDSGAALPVSAASQQTGTGIGAATALTGGQTLAFTDGTNNFTYTTAAANTDTLNTIVNAINGNPNFTASLVGNNLVITANNGQPINITTNTLTDNATKALKETFAASGTAVAGGSFSTSVTVHDALGASHVLTYSFTKTAANTWTYQITIPAADVGQSGAPVVVNSGTLTFNGNGQLVNPAGNVTGITISNLADGASPLTFNWNLYNPTTGGTITQVSGPSATSSTQQDGYSSGSLLSFTIGSDGTIEGVFSNGQTTPLAQIALATFANEQGLIRNGENEFLGSLASGAANVGAPTTGGRGALSGGSLEQSNVDIATEFAKLIVTERSYQANAKSITTFDQVTQTAINLVQ
ncbi:MAG TPA: flagellar hook-basal body complex protein [Methylomirabilota bacterium]|nr:flagellar hook-basal body complex protein [Methylomirabilota bacterium]